MAKLCRIDSKSSSGVRDIIPLVLVPINPRRTVAIQTQTIPTTFIIDSQSLRSNMNTNRAVLQHKLATRPAQTYLIQRGILQAEARSRTPSTIIRLNECDALNRKIEQRPSKQKLVTQHILLSASNTHPLILKKAEALKRCKLRDNLNKKLQHRPGPLDLITKKILQADAELEQAIREGRLLFPKTTDHENNPVDESISHDTDMEILSTASVCAHQTRMPNICSKSKIRKKIAPYHHRSPYEQPSPSSLKLRIQERCRSPLAMQVPCDQSIDCMNFDTEVCSTNSNSQSQEDGSREMQKNYDLLLQQQELFLQWQQEVGESRANASSRNEVDRGASVDKCGACSSSPSISSLNSHNSNAFVEYMQVNIPAQSSTLPDCKTSNTKSCCQCSAATNYNSDPTLSSELTSSDIDKPKFRLSDYRVQDLKSECKKRQLPVSGAKVQLLERLKPFEDAILASAGAATPENQCDVNTTSSSVCDTTSLNMNRLPPISNFIDDYLQHSASNLSQTSSDQLHRMPQQLQQMVMPVHMNHSQQQQSIQQSQQILQLVDSNGSVVAVAALPSTLQCCCMSTDCTQIQGSAVSTASAANMGVDSHGVNGSQQSYMQIPNASSQLVVQSQAEPTFSFSQLGSGGQFTLIQSAPQVDRQEKVLQTSSVHRNARDISQASAIPPQTTVAQILQSGCQMREVIVSECSGLQNVNADVVFSHCDAQTLQQNQTLTHLHPIASRVNGTCSVQQNSQSQFVVGSELSAARISAQDCCQSNASQHALCPPMQATQQSAGCSPITADSVCGCSPNVPSPTSVVAKNSPQDIHNYHIDPNDANALLSATTLSIHEEMLRYQQRKIDELQKELHRSQQQLKHQQRVILAAKKAQQAKKHETNQEGNQQQSQADLWLNQLDIKHLNKFHIQLFLQHKYQQQQMQAQVIEQHNLTTIEQKLQEELHVEQAVKDIVRLIKQDARTALLIVQLLRRYQLERNQAVSAASQPIADTCIGSESRDAMEENVRMAECEGGHMSEQCVSDQMPVGYSEQQPKTNYVVINDEPRSNNEPIKSKPKKRNISRSVMSKIDNANGKDKSNGSGTSIDMEEIFKMVMEKASKALLPNDCDKSSKDSPHEVEESSFCDQFVNPSQDQQQISSSFDGHAIEDAAAECNANQKFLYDCEHMTQRGYDHLLSNMIGGFDRSIMCDVGNNTYEERIEVLDEGAVAVGVSNEYSENCASIDDLMDVIRDDHPTNITENNSTSMSFEMDKISASDELMNLLGDNWFDSEVGSQTTSISYHRNSCERIEHSSRSNGENNFNGMITQFDQSSDSMMNAFGDNNLDSAMNMDWLDAVIPSPLRNDFERSSCNAIVADSSNSFY